MNISSIRVAGYANAPYILPCFDKYPNDCNNPGPGIDAEFIYTLFSHIWQIPVVWIRTANRSQMHQALVDDLADVEAEASILDEEMTSRMQASPACHFDSLALLVRPKILSSANEFHTTSFVQTELWALVAITTLSVYLMHRLSKRMSTGEVKLVEKEGGSILQALRFMREKLIYPFTFMAVLIFLNVYANIIAVNLVKKGTIKDFGFNTLDELAKLILNKRCRFVMQAVRRNDFSFNRFLLNPTARSVEPWTVTMNTAYKSNPPLYVATRQEIIQVVHNATHCFYGVDYYHLRDFYKYHSCDLEMLSLAKYTPEQMFIFYYRSTALKELFGPMLSSTMYVLFDKLMLKYFQQNSTLYCPQPLCTQVYMEPGKVQDCFFIVITGMLASLFAFFIELYMFKLKKTNNLSIAN
ncbi:hypothetical protein T10_11940 [Trichinella papuae]|uniref:Ionotropic glutamate receptor C-terminal domain-containing protein n=1 Tax=Trichinella papuae TaxID=268474 RepID=A0A0V1MFJ7_9BILA|nr:hypothetical protein T10_11940 [Trichinella papuae]